MRIQMLAIVALPLAACMTPYEPQEVEAVRDFLAATELEEVDNIRLFSTQLHYTYVNDFYVTVPTRRKDFLVEFRTQCRALRRRDFTPDMVDVRSDPSIIRAKFDTIRGCHIDKIYQVTEQQREELEDLGDAPGEETFLPDEEKPNNDSAK